MSPREAGVFWLNFSSRWTELRATVQLRLMKNKMPMMAVSQVQRILWYLQQRTDPRILMRRLEGVLRSVFIFLCPRKKVGSSC